MATITHRTNRRQFLEAAGWRGLTACLWPLTPAWANGAVAQEPSWQSIQKVLERHFQSQSDLERTDLISRSQVAEALEAIRKAGWTPPGAKKMLQDTLPENDFLVAEFRTKRGQRFMRKLARQKLIYDQLDRIAHEDGGKTLIGHLIRLPDGEQFVRSGRARTVPGLVELLPKQGNGKSRRVRDFDKPTGKIYTIDQLTARLQAAYQAQANRASEVTAE